MHLSWLDPHKMRKMTVVGTREDGRVRRHGARPQGHRVREGAVEAGRTRTASGRRARATSTSRRSRPTSRSSSSAVRFLALVERRGRSPEGRARTARASCGARHAHDVAEWQLRSTRRATVYPGHGARGRREGARERGRREAALALAALDREARAAAADRDRRGHRSSRPARSSSPARGSALGSSSATSRACASA